MLPNYLFKIIEGIVPNPYIFSFHNTVSNNFKVQQSSRNGRYCTYPNVNRQSSIKLQNIRSSSFIVHASKLFNVLPKEIRNISHCTVDMFKSHLDLFLESVPDMPHLPGLGKYCPVSSNSLIDMVPVYT